MPSQAVNAFERETEGIADVLKDLEELLHVIRLFLSNAIVASLARCHLVLLTVFWGVKLRLVGLFIHFSRLLQHPFSMPFLPVYDHQEQLTRY